MDKKMKIWKPDWTEVDLMEGRKELDKGAMKKKSKKKQDLYKMSKDLEKSVEQMDKTMKKMKIKRMK